MTAKRCETTTAVYCPCGTTHAVRCWLLEVQHERDPERKHWTLIDGKPYEWETSR